MTETAQPPLTLSVPEAGKKYFGLSRERSYDAARRGDLPTIKIGRLLRVPVRALLQTRSRSRRTPRNRNSSRPGKPIKAQFSDGKWHSFETIVRRRNK
jgi:hypothetical protein